MLELIGRKFVNTHLSTEIDSLRNIYKDVDELKTLDSNSIIEKFNPGIVSFLKGVTGRPVNVFEDSKYSYRFAVTLEAVYKLKNSNLVLSHSFIANLIQTTVSGSKLVTQVNSKILPASGDTLLRSWLKDNGMHELDIPKEGNLAVWYDNIGKYIIKIISC